MSSNQIPVTNHTSPDAALLWNAGRCDGFTTTPVLPNTNSQVCGLQSTNASLLNACCNGAPIQQYQCWTYCSYPFGGADDYAQMVRCLNQQSGNSSRVRQDVFCQAGVTQNNVATRSFAFRQSAPRIGWVFLVVMGVLLFISPASAAIIPSLDDGALAKRQSPNSQCTFTIHNNYTSFGPQRLLTNSTFCDAPRDQFCYTGTHIDTGIENNNRTINGRSAAETSFDAFFNILANQTGRFFPAMSSLEMQYWWTYVPQQRSELSWSAFHWCANGTTNNCKGTLGDNNDPMNVQACGPLFVGEPKSVNGSGAVIQGNLGVIITGA